MDPPAGTRRGIKPPPCESSPSAHAFAWSRLTVSDSREGPTVFAGNFFVPFLGLVQECLHHAVCVQGNETALKNTRECEFISSCRSACCNKSRNCAAAVRNQALRLFVVTSTKTAPQPGSASLRIASKTLPQPATAFKNFSSAVVCRPFGGEINKKYPHGSEEHPIRGFHKGLPPCAGGWFHKEGVPE